MNSSQKSFLKLFNNNFYKLRSHLEKLSNTEDLFEFIHQMREAYYEFLKLTQTENKEPNRIAFYRSCWKSERVRYLSTQFRNYARKLEDQDLFYKNNALRCGAAMIDNTGTFVSDCFIFRQWIVAVCHSMTHLFHRCC